MKLKRMAQALSSLSIFMIAGCDANSLDNGREFVDDGNNEGLVFIEGGIFTNPYSNLYGSGILLEDFWIGKHEVTQAEWVNLMGSNPSLFIGDNLPVERVSWYDAIVFLNKLSEQAGLVPFYDISETPDPNHLGELDHIRWTITPNLAANGYRLPSELEWEFAASGGSLSQSQPFSGSDAPLEAGWHFNNSGDEIIEGFWHWPTLEANNGRTHPVGSKAPNELGLYDMSGNVREWVWDWFGESLNPESGQGRSVRGGGWVGGEDTMRIDFRDMLEPHFQFEDLGFRIARNAQH